MCMCVCSRRQKEEEEQMKREEKNRERIKNKYKALLPQAKDIYEGGVIRYRDACVIRLIDFTADVPCVAMM